MPLSNELWRRQLDDHLDVYVRRHIAQDAMEYSAAEMETIFKEHLNPVSELTSFALFEQSGPLETFIERSNVQKDLSEGNSALSTEKWQTSKIVMDYLKGIVNLNSLKNEKSERTSQLWNIEIPPTSTRFVQPLLSQVAMRETPFDCDNNIVDYSSQGSSHSNQRGRKSQLASTLAIPNVSCLFKTFPTEEEIPLSDFDRRALTEPRLRISREDTTSVLSLVKSTPFSAAVPKEDVLRSTRTISFNDNDGLMEGILPFTPPLFPRKEKSLSIIQRTGNSLKSDIAPLLSPVRTQDNSEMNMQTQMMELIDGFEMPSPTPTIVYGTSENDTGNFASEENEHGEFPSSPSIGTNILAKLLDGRIEKVLLPRTEELPSLQTRTTTSYHFTDQSFVTTLTGVLEGGMDVPLPSSPRLPGQADHERVSEVLCSDIARSLDSLGGGMTSMDVYSLISGETLEDQESSILLPVPNLTLSHESARKGRLLPQVLADLRFLPLDVPLGPSHPSIKPSCFLEPTGSVVSLALSLSWQPFYYKGNFFSDETVCMVDQLLSSTGDGEARHLLDAYASLSGVSSPETWPEYLLDNEFSFHEWPDDRILLSRREQISQNALGIPGVSRKTSRTVTDGISRPSSPPAAFPPPPELPFPSPFRRSEIRVDGVIEAESGTSRGVQSDGGSPHIQPFAPGDGHIASISTPNNFSLFVDESPRTEQREIINTPPTWSSRASLHQYLAQRGVVTQADRGETGSLEPGEGDSLRHNDPNDAHSLETNASAKEMPLLSAFLSTNIALPKVWTVPSDSHRYLCSIHTVQRRALAQSLKEECNVDLYELSNMIHPDIVVDSHSAVLFITLSDIPSTLDTLTSEISELAYGFSRILVILESFPADRAQFSTERWKDGHWAQLTMFTKTISETCLKLKNKVNIKLGLLDHDEHLERSEETSSGQALGDTSVEFVISLAIEDSARFVRIFGDYSAGLVTPLERAKLGGARVWLDTVQEEVASCILGRYRGMNVFTALAIASVTPLSNFVAMSSQEKLHSFGTLVGNERMILFDKTYRRAVGDT